MDEAKEFQFLIMKESLHVDSANGAAKEIQKDMRRETQLVARITV